MSKLLVILLLLFMAYQWLNIDTSSRSRIWDNTTAIPSKTIHAFSNFADSFRDAQVVNGG